MDNLGQLNAILSANQILVVCVAVPLAALIFGWLGARGGARRVLRGLEAERRAVGAARVGAVRQAWLEELRADLAEFQGLIQSPTDGMHGRTTHERLSILFNRILLRIDPADPSYKELCLAMDGGIECFEKGSSRRYNPEAFRSMAQGIIARDSARMFQEIASDPKRRAA